jgi:hypothetical protein
MSREYRCEMGGEPFGGKTYTHPEPAVNGGDDARRAEWIPADSYDQLREDLARHFGGRVFAAHVAMLGDFLAGVTR